MRILITGSSGHLGEALVRHFRDKGDEVVGLDIVASKYTRVAGSILDRGLVDELMARTDAVLHAATLHKPHVASHRKQQFIDVNVIGTQMLLDSAVKHGVGAFVLTSTTSTFGHAMSPEGSEEAVWVTEELRPVPKNIYGVTKVAAEDLCQLASQEHGLPCVVLKTSRFFPEEDDQKHAMPGFSQDNIKAIEFLNRRVDIEDVVSAHEKAVEKAEVLGFDKFIVTATTPFKKSDCRNLVEDAPSVLKGYFPDYEAVFSGRGWKMFSKLGRVYSNERAREKLEWEPRYNFGEILKRLQNGKKLLSDLAYSVGVKGYYPVVRSGNSSLKSASE